MIGLLQVWQSRRFGPMDAKQWVDQAIQAAELQGFTKFHVSYDESTNEVPDDVIDGHQTWRPGLRTVKITVHGS